MLRTKTPFHIMLPGSSGGRKVARVEFFELQQLDEAIARLEELGAD